MVEIQNNKILLGGKKLQFNKKIKELRVYKGD